MIGMGVIHQLSLKLKKRNEPRKPYSSSDQQSHEWVLLEVWSAYIVLMKFRRSLMRRLAYHRTEQWKWREVAERRAEHCSWTSNGMINCDGVSHGDFRKERTSGSRTNGLDWLWNEWPGLPSLRIAEVFTESSINLLFSKNRKWVIGGISR